MAKSENKLIESNENSDWKINNIIIIKVDKNIYIVLVYWKILVISKYIMIVQ